MSRVGVPTSPSCYGHLRGSKRTEPNRPQPSSTSGIVSERTRTSESDDTDTQSTSDRRNTSGTRIYRGTRISSDRPSLGENEVHGHSDLNVNLYAHGPVVLQNRVEDDVDPEHRVLFSRPSHATVSTPTSRAVGKNPTPTRGHT